jgi:uncharacterized protein YcnI
MRKVCLPLVLLTALAALLVPATAARAHASLPPALEVGTTSTIPLDVPHERDSHNVEVAIRIPAGWQVLAPCIAQETWSCVLGTDSGFQTVTWTKDPGAALADDETFRMRIRAASSVGTYSFPTVQVYEDGTEAAWIGPASSEEPAPVIRTVPRTGGPTTVPTAPPPTHTPTTRPAGPTPTQSPTPTSPGGQVGPSGPTPTVAPPPAQPGVTTTTRPGATTTTTDRSGTTTTAGATTTDDPDSNEESDDATVDESSGGFGGEIEEAGAPDLGTPDDDGSDGTGLAVLAIVVLVIGGAGAAIFLRQRAVNRRAATDDV